MLILDRNGLEFGHQFIMSNSRLMGSQLYPLVSLLTDSDWFGVSMFQILRTCEHLDTLLTLQTYFSTYAVFIFAANVLFFSLGLLYSAILLMLTLFFFPSHSPSYSSVWIVISRVRDHKSKLL